jgi:hypothetical protein
MPDERTVGGTPTGILGSGFDACPACEAAARDAVGQAFLYLVSQAAPSLVSPNAAGSIAYGFVVRLRIVMVDGAVLVDEEFTVDQELALVDPTSVNGSPAHPGYEEPLVPGPAGPTTHPLHLEDFQVLIDTLALGPGPAGHSVEGEVEGRLFEHERSLARFSATLRPGP